MKQEGRWPKDQVTEHALQERIHTSDVGQEFLPIQLQPNFGQWDFFFFHIVGKRYVYFPKKSKRERYITLGTI